MEEKEGIFYCLHLYYTSSIISDELIIINSEMYILT